MSLLFGARKEAPQSAIPNHQAGGELLGNIGGDDYGTTVGGTAIAIEFSGRKYEAQQKLNPLLQTSKTAAAGNNNKRQKKIASKTPPHILIGLYGVDCPLATAHLTQLVEMGFYNGASVSRVKRDHWLEIGGAAPPPPPSNPQSSSSLPTSAAVYDDNDADEYGPHHLGAVIGPDVTISPARLVAEDFLLQQQLKQKQKQHEELRRSGVEKKSAGIDDEASSQTQEEKMAATFCHRIVQNTCMSSRVPVEIGNQLAGPQAAAAHANNAGDQQQRQPQPQRSVADFSKAGLVFLFTEEDDDVDVASAAAAGSSYSHTNQQQYAPRKFVDFSRLCITLGGGVKPMPQLQKGKTVLIGEVLQGLPFLTQRVNDAPLTSAEDMMRRCRGVDTMDGALTTATQSNNNHLSTSVNDGIPTKLIRIKRTLTWRQGVNNEQNTTVNASSSSSSASVAAASHSSLSEMLISSQYGGSQSNVELSDAAAINNVAGTLSRNFSFLSYLRRLALVKLHRILMMSKGKASGAVDSALSFDPADDHNVNSHPPTGLITAATTTTDVAKFLRQQLPVVLWNNSALYGDGASSPTASSRHAAGATTNTPFYSDDQANADNEITTSSGNSCRYRKPQIMQYNPYCFRSFAPLSSSDDDDDDDGAGAGAATGGTSPTPEGGEGGRITSEDMRSLRQQAEKARSQRSYAIMLQLMGQLPDADMEPPENVLFVCKLNPLTTGEDLKTIFSQFGEIDSAEVIYETTRERFYAHNNQHNSQTNNNEEQNRKSLQYGFIEFKTIEACQRAYDKMDNVLIDDCRIHVDYSQSVSKVWATTQQQKRKQQSQQQQQKKQPHPHQNKQLRPQQTRRVEGGRGSDESPLGAMIGGVTGGVRSRDYVAPWQLKRQREGQ